MGLGCKLLKLLSVIFLTFVLLVTTLGVNPGVSHVMADEEQTGETQDETKEENDDAGLGEDDDQETDEDLNDDTGTQQESEEDSDIDEQESQEENDGLSDMDMPEEEEMQMDQQQFKSDRGNSSYPPMVQEGVIFDNDIEYNTYFKFPELVVEGSDDYLVMRDYVRQFTRSSVSVVVPNTDNPTIYVDYGVIGTLNGVEVVLSAVLSDFVPFNSATSGYGVSRFDYDELDALLENDEDITNITKNYPADTTIIGKAGGSSAPNNAQQMYINIGNDPRIGFYTFNIESYRLSFDIRYADGHPLEDSIITYYSLNSYAEEDVVKATEGKYVNIPMATAVDPDGNSVSYVLSVPDYYYPREGNKYIQTESVKPINHTKTSVTETSDMLLRPYNFYAVGKGIVDPDYTETVDAQGNIIRTFDAGIGSEGWYFAYGKETKPDYLMNPLTGVVDKINPDIALTVFYPDSRNMEAYIGTIHGGIWETSNIVAKGIRRDLTIKKEANVQDGTEFNFKIKIWRDVETEEIDFYEETFDTVAYAVFDSSSKTLTFFRDEAGAYSNGQKSGTKTYYTNVENYSAIGKSLPWSSIRSQIEKVVFNDVIVPLSTESWFNGSTKLSSVENIKNLRMHEVKSSISMFAQCKSLTTLDTSGFYMPKCRTFGNMFQNCSNLTYLDLSNISFLSWLSIPGQASIGHGINYFLDGCSKLSTEILLPVMPMNHYYVFKNAATEPGAQIKIKAYSLSDYQIQELIDTKENDNSNVVFAGYVEYDDIFPKVPEYLNETIVRKSEQIIYDLTDDDRFVYSLDTKEYFFTLKAGESLTIENIPKGYHYEIHELDSWRGEPLEEKDLIDDSWTFYSAVNSVGVIENDDIVSTFTNKAPGSLEVKKETFNDEEGSFEFKIRIWKDTYEYLREVGVRHSAADNSVFGVSHEIEFYDYADIEGTVFKIFNIEGNAIVTDENTNPSGTEGEYKVLDDSHHHVYHDLHNVVAIDPLQSVIDADAGIDMLLELEAVYHGQKLYQDVGKEEHNYHVGENLPEMLQDAKLYTHHVLDEEQDDENYKLIRHTETYFDLSAVAGMTPVTDKDSDGVADDGIYKFTLKSGEKLDLKNIPYDYKYEVWEETDDVWALMSVDEDEDKTKAEGIITSAVIQKHVFKNIAEHTLTISKSVVADEIDTTKQFEFTITSSVQLKNNKLTNEKKQTVDGRTTYTYRFVLKHNEKIEIGGLLYKSEYTIEEKQDGNYITTVDGRQGYVANVVIEEDTEVKYVNRKIRPYHVTYRYEGDLPDKVLETLPSDSADYYPGSTAYSTTLSSDRIFVDDTLYIFNGWDNRSIEIVDKDVEFVGTWSTSPKSPDDPSFKVTYRYEGDLPKEVMDTLPVDNNEYPAETNIKARSPSESEIIVSGGTWVFLGWDKQEDTIIDSDIVFTGKWEFVRKRKPAVPYTIPDTGV